MADVRQDVRICRTNRIHHAYLENPDILSKASPVSTLFTIYMSGRRDDL